MASGAVNVYILNMLGKSSIIRLSTGAAAATTFFASLTAKQQQRAA
jgi:hypothetical protein